MDHAVVFWIFVAVVMGVVEGATLALVSIWFFVGAVAAAITATITPSMEIQTVVFVVVTGGMLVATRPIVKRLTKRGYTPTNADRIIGADAIVTKKIDPIEGTGQINVSGQIWSAKSENSTKIEKDEIVTVTKIVGVHAIVQPKEEKQ